MLRLKLTRSHEVVLLLSNSFTSGSSFITVVTVLAIFITIVVLATNEVGDHLRVVVAAIICCLACCNFRLLFPLLLLSAILLLFFCNLRIVYDSHTINYFLQID